MWWRREERWRKDWWVADLERAAREWVGEGEMVKAEGAFLAAFGNKLVIFCQIVIIV